MLLLPATAATVIPSAVVPVLSATAVVPFAPAVVASEVEPLSVVVTVYFR